MIAAIIAGALALLGAFAIFVDVAWTVFLFSAAGLTLVFPGVLPPQLRPRNLFLAGIALMVVAFLIEPAVLTRRPENPVSALLGVAGFLLALIAPFRWVLARFH